MHLVALVIMQTSNLFGKHRIKEPMYIKNVGHKPALRLIDVRWGNLESQETHKHKFPSWRPQNDNKVCGYSFFIFMEVSYDSSYLGL